FTLLLSILTWSAGPTLLSRLSMKALIPYAPLVVAGVFATALYELMKFWGIRKRAYEALAKSSTTQSLSGNFAKIALGLLSFKPAGLLLAQIVRLGGGVVPLFKLWLRDARHHRRHIRWSVLWKLALRFRDMPCYRLPSQLLLSFAIQAPLIFSAKLY